MTFLLFSLYFTIKKYLYNRKGTVSYETPSVLADTRYQIHYNNKDINIIEYEKI